MSEVTLQGVRTHLRALWRAARQATIARLIGPEISHSMGAGVATFDDCSIAWTVLYDEVIVVLEGAFTPARRRRGP